MQLWRMGYKFVGVPARDVSVFSLPMLAPWPANEYLLRLGLHDCLVCSKSSDGWWVDSIWQMGCILGWNVRVFFPTCFLFATGLLVSLLRLKWLPSGLCCYNSSLLTWWVGGSVGQSSGLSRGGGQLASPYNFQQISVSACTSRIKKRVSFRAPTSSPRLCPGSGGKLLFYSDRRSF